MGADVGAPADHLVHFAHPAGARQSLRLDEIVLVAREAGALVERLAAGGGHEVRGRRLGSEVRRQVVEHRLALAGFDRGAPAHHLVEGAAPRGPSQSLLSDEVRLMTAHAARRSPARVPGPAGSSCAMTVVGSGRSMTADLKTRRNPHDSRLHLDTDRIRRVPEIPGRIPRRRRGLRPPGRIRRARQDQVRLGAGGVEGDTRSVATSTCSARQRVARLPGGAVIGRDLDPRDVGFTRPGKTGHVDLASAKRRAISGSA